MRTSGLGRFSVGQPMPPRSHAVCVSLPTVRDLIGYEEKEPDTLQKMPIGYPRFVRHHFVQQMIDVLAEENPLPGYNGYLFKQQKDCDACISLGKINDAKVQAGEEFTFLRLPIDSPSQKRISSFFQNTGCGLSSREAETFLWEKGKLENREVIAEIEEPERLIKQTIARAHGPEVGESDLLLTSSGANAFFATFTSAQEQASQANKDIWLRLGWLYLDTIEVMHAHTSPSGKTVAFHDVGDLHSLEQLFAKQGERIAGVMTEFPTNPLLQATDLGRVRELCDQYGSLLFVDPTMVSPKNAKVTHLADIVINSLTKYAGWEGDVMMGSLAFPRNSSRGRALFDSIRNKICPPYHRDLLRMAEQIPHYEDFIAKTNRASMEVARFLQSHPKIQSLYWAYQPGFGENYQKYAGEMSPGCNLSFEVLGDFEQFYDHLDMLKSPSFGTEFSNCCPYVYLAHYAMMQNEQGRKELAEAGISPELMRLSVGLEDTQEIISALERALEHA